MINRFTFLFSILCCLNMVVPLRSDAQELNDNVYRNSANHMYWQNRKPFEGYWQQDVHYIIDASIDEELHTITASETLHYWNNSPDTLKEVYFHLYQNAFVKGSYLEKLHQANEQPVKHLGKYSSLGLGTQVSNLKADQKALKATLDNTILKVYLNTPLLPGASTTFSMDFTTYFEQNDFRRRMKIYNSWGAVHFNGVHWYPRISVYDIKKGWDTDQHLNKELYGDYGLFDVKLNFASNYVVEATGELQNPDEVFPGDLRSRLDIKNFANKPWNEKPSIITPYDKTQRKTWHFVGYNVHDFAFTADPHYRLGETEWNGIKCIALVTEPHASKWQTTPAYIADIIRTFSSDFGMYEYPKMVVADASDGMEYPMLTLCGGADPDHHGLLAHEIGHNWFYGMIGNNETYRAALDEGFTQFITAWALEKLDGPLIIASKPKNKYLAKHKKPEAARDARVFHRYINETIHGHDKALNTHSDDFNGALGHEGGYRLVYYKTATMLFNLQYVLGDDLFLAAMQHYVSKWKIAHPYFEDFRQSIIEFTHQDLNWFFDQWMETTKTLDYGIVSVKKTLIPDEYKIKFKRIGEMQMPLDFRVTAHNKKIYDYSIPNSWHTKAGKHKVLPKWTGWSILNPTYTTKLTIPSGIKLVQIDPSHRLADIDMMNNYKKPGLCLPREAYHIQLENFVNSTADLKRYEAYWRPDVWWNPIDGIKAGVLFDGAYMNFLRKIKAGLWLNTRALSKLQYRSFEGQSWWQNASPIDYTFNYETPLKKISRHINWGVSSRFIDGMARHSAYTTYNLTARDEFRLEATTLYRPGNYTTAYLFYPQEWSSFSKGGARQTNKNSYLQLLYTHQYQFHESNGKLRMTLRSPLNFNYAYLQGELTNRKQWHKLDINSRAFIRMGTGNEIPYESALFMQGGNPEEMMENKFTRSQGVLPAELGGMSTSEFANIHAGGGLNLRGYNGYYAIDEKNGIKYINYKGRSGAAINVEVEFDRLISFKPKWIKEVLHVDPYLFADAGAMSRGILDGTTISKLDAVKQWSKIRMDAGIGAAFTIKRFGPLNKLQPFTFRIDLPFFISAPPNAQPDEWDFRWVIGVNRAF